MDPVWRLPAPVLGDPECTARIALDCFLSGLLQSRWLGWRERWCRSAAAHVGLQPIGLSGPCSGSQDDEHIRRVFDRGCGDSGRAALWMAEVHEKSPGWTQGLVGVLSLAVRSQSPWTGAVERALQPWRCRPGSGRGVHVPLSSEVSLWKSPCTRHSRPSCTLQALVGRQLGHHSVAGELAIFSIENDGAATAWRSFCWL